MEIEKKQIELVTLIANEGMYITQAYRGCDAPIMCKKVVLGKKDSPENWVEIPIEEGDRIVAEWQAEQEKRMQEEMNNATR